jgi:hypothetical protein
VEMIQIAISPLIPLNSTIGEAGYVMAVQDLPEDEVAPL